jgi:hypothetical protein
MYSYVRLVAGFSVDLVFAVEIIRPFMGEHSAAVGVYDMAIGIVPELSVLRRGGDGGKCRRHSECHDIEFFHFAFPFRRYSNFSVAALPQSPWALTGHPQDANFGVSPGSAETLRMTMNFHLSPLFGTSPNAEYGSDTSSFQKSFPLVSLETAFEFHFKSPLRLSHTPPAGETAS